MKILSTFSLCFIAVPLMAHVNTGELSLRVIDSMEIGLKATVALSSEANQYFSEFTTDANGTAEIKTLSYDVHRLNIEKQGFSSISKTLEIRSAIPVKRTLQLGIAPINTVVQVSDAGTLLDPNRPSSIMQIGSAQIEYRVASLALPKRNVDAALSHRSGHFPDSKGSAQHRPDVLPTLSVTPRIWLTKGLLSGSGLSFEFEGEQSDALAQYGPAVASRLNFDRGRGDPSLSIRASRGVDIYKGERINSRFQIDGDNLNNRLNIVDFGGLFSGNAIRPARSFSLRLNTRFSYPDRRYRLPA